MSYLPESSPYQGIAHSGSVTALWVQAAVVASHIKRIERAKCAKCKTIAFYTVENLNLVYTDCKCADFKVSPIQWHVAAALITMQPTTPSRRELALRFGIDLSDKDWQHKIAKDLSLPHSYLSELNHVGSLLFKEALCSTTS